MNKPDFAFPLNDPFTQSCIEELKNHPKRFVFTEGEDLRILQVAEKMVELEIGSPILLGKRDIITNIAQENGINLEFISMIDPATSPDLDLFIQRLEKIERFKGAKVANPHEMMSSPFYYASMMVQYGHADALIGGNTTSPAILLRATQQLIKPENDVPHIFAATLLIGRGLPHFGRDGYLLLSDTAITPEPSIEELTAIALTSADLSNRLFNIPPRVAMLSHSSKGSNPTPSAKRIAGATELARNQVMAKGLNINIDGEIQADVALDPNAAEIKVPHMDQKGPVDVLVFPSLDAAHISSKFVQLAQVPMTSCPDLIFGTVTALGLEALHSRERNKIH